MSPKVPTMELTDIEKEKIVQFNNDTVLVEAVRKVMLASVYSNGTLREGKPSEPTKNAALSLAFMTLSGSAIVSNEELGADLRGLAQGVMLLERGFKQLSEIKPDVASPYTEETNPAV